MRANGIDTFDELLARSVADIAWFWDAVVQDLGIEFIDPYVDVVDRSRGPEWATWFTQGTINLAHQCVDLWAERTPEAVAVVWEGEDGETRQATYRRAPRPHRSARERARHPGGTSAPHRGHLPADGDRDRRRDHGVREARRDLGADLQRVRPRCGGGSAGRRPHPGGDHRRRNPAEGLARRDEGGGRPRARTGGRCAPRRGVGPPSRSSDADDARPRPLVARAGRRGGALVRDPGARLGTSLVHRLHQRNDGPAQGRRARPRRVRGEDRRGGRLSGGPASRRGAALGHRPRLDHGAVGDRRRARPGLDGAAHRRRAHASRAGPAVGHGGTPRGDDARASRPR